ncbi:MAG TPA: NADH-quinone oxidoreductase subunit C [Nakamurella sp.]|nr:NADH-quinone oxidoreductase subunit C [Nakamurella sp.]
MNPDKTPGRPASEPATGQPEQAASPAAGVPAVRDPGELPAQQVPAAPPTGRPRTGMFGVHGTGDTSGYGGLVREPYTPPRSERPYGGYFDEVADALAAAMADRQIPATAIEQVSVAHGEMTVYVAREHLVALLQACRDDVSLRFELASSISGVDYGEGVPRRLHVVYELLSMTYRRRIRLEVAVDVADATVPSAVAVYPTADWHEREVWDMFGVEFAGHPGLTRILMPDDWIGFPQRKDYPLGGIPVEYKGAEVASPDQRRAYS